MSADEGSDKKAPTSVSVDEGSDQKPTSSVSTDQGATKTTASVQQDEPGVAKIKHEYLLLDYKPTIDTEYISDNVKDEMKNEGAEKKNEDDTEEEPAAKKVKLTGRNKKRPKRKRIQAGDKICPAISRDQICSYGNKCKFSHDKSKFMAAKLPDISDQCYLFETYGKCPFGLSCRFSSKHITEDFKNIVKENFNEEKLNSSVKNVLKKDNQVLLWKRKYDFSKANAIIDEMGCRNPKEKQGARNSKKDLDKGSKFDAARSDSAIKVSEQDKKDECIASEIDINVSCDSNIVPKTSSIATDTDKGSAVDDGKVSNDSNTPNTTENIVLQSVREKNDVAKLEETENIATISGAGDSSVNNVNHISSQMQKNGLSEDAHVETKSSLGAAASEKDTDLGIGVGPDMEVDEGVIRLRPMEKKKVNFADKLYLAPLTTVGNLPYRRICKRLGADITCGEMAVATNLLQGQASEWALLKRHESEDLFGVQICGAYPDTMTRCAQIINDTLDVDFVDINCGCPIDLIFNKGEGSALMGRAGKFGQIVKGMTSVLDVPLTVKMRTGIYNDRNNAHTLVPKLKEWGVALTTIHGRSRVQRYTKTADWDYISECAKLAAPMPLFGNGDILSYEEANERREHTGVSGLMLARGALIKPWIFTEIKEQRHWDISASERFDILRDFTNFGLEHWGSDQQGVESTRRFLLEWLSFLYRYIPVGVLDRLPQKINERPPYYKGRNDLETLMASPNCGDWVKISEMLLGPVPEDFTFLPKHKANAYK